MFESIKDEELKNILIYLRPIVFTEYDRKYFESKEKKLRITIDSNLIFRKASILSIFSKIMPYKIIEFKFSLEDKDYCLPFLKKIPFRSTRMSKYINALNTLSII